jgi:transposase
MLTREEDVDAHALRRRGWSISAIARHLGRDRKTVRAYLAGQRVSGQRAKPAADPFEPFVAYCRERLAEDPHLWAQTLHDELVELGFDRSYPTLTRQLRARGLRPVCQSCRPVSARPVAVIEHPPGEETQFDWVELPDPPASWGWGKTAYLLVGSLAHSGRWRGVLAESTDQAHLVEALHRVAAGLGGLTRTWRFDRMATVCHPATGEITASFAGVAKHYAVSVAICPPRRGNRKGVVEKANHTAAQRWWRTLADEVTVETAQAGLDRFCALRGDTRIRATTDGKASVVTVAEREPLAGLPAPFPATITVERAASAQALVSFRGNQYSVAPELARTRILARHRLDQPVLEITALDRPEVVLARHRLAAPGAGAVIRDQSHVSALNHAAMAAAGSGRPHRRKERIPPGPGARAAAEVLRAPTPTATAPTSTEADGAVIDLARWAAAAHGRNTLT